MYLAGITSMKSFLIQWYCSLLILKYVHPQKLLARHCPQVTSMREFDRDRYMGVWYQQAQFKSFLREEVMCKHVVYKPVGELGFRVEARMLARVLNGPVSIYGVGEPIKPSDLPSGKYVVTMIGEATNEDVSYNILYTDYTGISIVWSCDSFYKLWSKQNVQVLTRARLVNSTVLLASTLRTLLPQQLDNLLDLLSPIDQNNTYCLIPGNFMHVDYSLLNWSSDSWNMRKHILIWDLGQRKKVFASIMYSIQSKELLPVTKHLEKSRLAV